MNPSLVRETLGTAAVEYLSMAFQAGRAYMFIGSEVGKSKLKSGRTRASISVSFSRKSKEFVSFPFSAVFPVHDTQHSFQ